MTNQTQPELKRIGEVGQIILVIIFMFFVQIGNSQSTRLLREPDINDQVIVFTYGSDIWTINRTTSVIRRITSTPSVESDPHISPDGKTIAFSSNRFGASAVYIVPIEGGEPTRLTWHPSEALVRDWTPDGKHILYASSRDAAPAGFNRLWEVPVKGGPSKMISGQWGHRASYNSDGTKLIVDRVDRWDVEWRNYKGGQNTPLYILNKETQEELLLPFENSMDLKPIWLNGIIYFLSDRDWTMNIWSYNPADSKLEQLTKYEDTDIKYLQGHGNILVFERDGYLNTLDITSKTSNRIDVEVIGDFPWAEERWEKLNDRISSSSLSPNGKRVVMEARGEIFTVPIENGDSRNLTNSSNAADRNPIWSPKGDKIAWFSDAGGKGYSIMMGNQDGFTPPTSISIGESKMAWEPTWSPDGQYIAFVDDDVRIRIVNIDTKTIETADIGGTNMQRGGMGITWSPDSKWLAYSKTGSNNFGQIMLYNVNSKQIKAITDPFADATSPSWDMDQKHLYFLASTNLALGSGWANTSAIMSDAKYAAYVVNLSSQDISPFEPKSDEEEIKTENPSTDDSKKKSKSKEEQKEEKKSSIVIDFDNISRRTMALPISEGNYAGLLAGPAGNVFILEYKEGSPGLSIAKFSLEKAESSPFLEGARSVSISTDAKNMVARVGGDWKVISTSGSNGKDGKSLKMNLQMKLNRSDEWLQIFNEAWRYERDYFYDNNMHGRNWQTVYDRYAPLIPFVKHRNDLTYVLDQINGELSVGHSFVFGGDFPSTESSPVGLLGADLNRNNGGWQIGRIYTTENWNPGLSSPLDRPGIKVKMGDYLVGVNGKPLDASMDPYQLFDGTVGNQTTLHINSKPGMSSSWTVIVEPIRSENALRQRAWVEDNRRRVDELSEGKLAYVWVPNTSTQGFISFNRYFFAQQDKLGAVIDERFNGGGSLDDYMVDLMTRKLRAAITNEVPNGKPFQLPAGILGPKVLLVNELAGSGGDFFPWVFRQQQAGPLIGSTTWGGLVKSSVHYGLVDGGALTAPDNAVFDPVKSEWIGENKGIVPDISVRQDAKSLTEGKDPQLERAVKELLMLLDKQNSQKIIPPAYPTPAKKN